jgi:hypothetical protein
VSKPIVWADLANPVRDSRLGLYCRAKTEHDLFGGLLGNARKKDHATTARAPICRNACAVRIRIFRMAGCLILVKESLGRILEHLFRGNAERLLQRLRQRFECLSRLTGDHCDGRRAVPKNRRTRIVSPRSPLRRNRDLAGVFRVFHHCPPRRHCLRPGGLDKQEKQRYNYLFSHGWILPPAGIRYKASTCAASFRAGMLPFLVVGEVSPCCRESLYRVLSHASRPSLPIHSMHSGSMTGAPDLRGATWITVYGTGSVADTPSTNPMQNPLSGTSPGAQPSAHFRHPPPHPFLRRHRQRECHCRKPGLHSTAARPTSAASPRRTRPRAVLT